MRFVSRTLAAVGVVAATVALPLTTTAAPPSTASSTAFVIRFLPLDKDCRPKWSVLEYDGQPVYPTHVQNFTDKECEVVGTLHVAPDAVKREAFQVMVAGRRAPTKVVSLEAPPAPTPAPTPVATAAPQLSMDDAKRIALAKYPGTVTAARFVTTLGKKDPDYMIVVTLNGNQILVPVNANTGAIDSLPLSPYGQ